MPHNVVSLTERRARTIIDWDPLRIKAAERAADQGELMYAADLCEHMMTDDRIGGCLESLAGVTSLPLEFEGRGEDDPIVEALTEDWYQAFPEDELGQLIRWGRLLGVGLARVESWDEGRGGRVVPRLDVWHPRNLRFDWDSRQWFAKAESGEVLVDAEHDPQWILYTPFGKKRPWARASWRGIARWWLLKRYAVADWARYGERQGEGTQVAVASEGAREEDRQGLAADLKSMSASGVVVLPAGYDYKLVESTARTWETFRAQKECADTAAAISLCGQNLTTEVQGGSYSAATVHESVKWQVIRQVAESLSTTLHAQALNSWAEFNFGSADLAPWPRYDTSQPSDAAKTAEVARTRAEAYANMRAAGVSIEPEAWFERGELVFLEAQDIDAQQAQPAPAPERQARAAREYKGAQDYVIGLEESAQRVAARALASNVADLVHVIESAESYDDALAATVRAYGEMMPPAKLAEITKSAYVLANLAGRLAVDEEG